MSLSGCALFCHAWMKYEAKLKNDKQMADLKRQLSHRLPYDQVESGDFENVCILEDAMTELRIEWYRGKLRKRAKGKGWSMWGREVQIMEDTSCLDDFKDCRRSRSRKLMLSLNLNMSTGEQLEYWTTLRGHAACDMPNFYNCSRLLPLRLRWASSAPISSAPIISALPSLFPDGQEAILYFNSFFKFGWNKSQGHCNAG